MTISQFRTLNREYAISLPLTSIQLAERKHQKALENNHKITIPKKEPMCIVRQNGSEYELVVGYRDYMTAKNNGADTIQAVIVPDVSRSAFIKSLKNTFEMWDTVDVHEPDGWKKTAPRPEKIKSCIEMYENTGTFGKKIFISPKGIILDGYAAVCAARQIGVKKIPVFVTPTHKTNKPQK